MKETVLSDSRELVSREAKDRIRSGRWMERVRPSRFAVVVVEVPTVVADRARSLLREDDWSVEEAPSICSSDGDETLFVVRKKVHPVLPFDLDDDVHSSVRFVLDRGKIEPVAVTVDISQSAPALDWREWVPEMRGAPERAIRRRSTRATKIDQEEDAASLPDIRSDEATSERQADSARAENLSDNAREGSESTEDKPDSKNSDVEIRDLNRRLRSTKLYTASPDAAMATQIWNRHKLLLGLPQEAPLARATKRQDNHGKISLNGRRILSVLLLLIPIGGYWVGAAIGRSWTSILITALCVSIPIMGGFCWPRLERLRSSKSSRGTSEWALYSVVAGTQLGLGVALGYESHRRVRRLTDLRTPRFA
ncbi:hypothetical protein ACIGKR_31995 [Rhodococcus qingshengii]|uniref:hypothetical protein n=1 Tax=Rhodococcus qingshengii TaxID=334542 RepID=UPI0037C7437B